MNVQELQDEFRKRTLLIYAMYKNKTNGFNEVQKIVNEYYKNPVAVLARYGIR